MVIKVSDYVDGCFNSEDGRILFNVIKPILHEDKMAVVSFSGIDTISSSFINAAFIELLEYFSFDYIKMHLQFKDTLKHLNSLIKKRFVFEVSKKRGSCGHVAECACS